ncbi:MAG: RidA family protein [Burkholderiales bacterium]
MKIESFNSDTPRPLANYSEVVRAGPYVFPAGQVATDFQHGIAPSAKRGASFPYYGSDIKLQTRYILENFKKTLAAAGSSLDNVIKAQVFLTDLKNFNAFDEVWKEYFKTPPPRTTIGTTALLLPDALIEIDLVAYTPGRGADRQAIKSNAPQPLAVYTEAFVCGHLVYAAGQLASDFKAGVAPEARKAPGFPYYGSDIKRQTRFILENCKKTFEAAGSSLDEVVKAQVFLTDLNDFNEMDEVWREFFKTPPPRTTVGTTGLLVQDTLVEIDLIASKGVKREIIKSAAPTPMANYSEAFKVGDIVFAAGQIASDYKTGVPPEARIDPNFPYYGSAIKKQTRYILENLKKTFEAAGSSLDHVVKSQVFLTDPNNFNGFDEVWKEYFKVPPPRTTVGTSGLLVKDTLVEIDLVGVVK